MHMWVLAKPWPLNNYSADGLFLPLLSSLRTRRRLAAVPKILSKNSEFAVWNVLLAWTPFYGVPLTLSPVFLRRIALPAALN